MTITNPPTHSHRHERLDYDPDGGRGLAGLGTLARVR